MSTLSTISFRHCHNPRVAASKLGFSLVVVALGRCKGQFCCYKHQWWIDSQFISAQRSRLLLQTPIVNRLTVYIDAKNTFAATNTNSEQIDSLYRCKEHVCCYKPIVNRLTVYIDAKVTFVATNTNGEQIDSFTSIVNKFTVYIAEKIMFVPANTNSQSQSLCHGKE